VNVIELAVFKAKLEAADRLLHEALDMIGTDFEANTDEYYLFHGVDGTVCENADNIYRVGQMIQEMRDL